MSNSIHISNYNLHPRYHFKLEVCASSNPNMPIALLVDLESLNSDVTGLKICLSPTASLLCLTLWSNSKPLTVFDNPWPRSHEILSTPSWSPLPKVHRHTPQAGNGWNTPKQILRGLKPSRFPFLTIWSKPSAYLPNHYGLSLNFFRYMFHSQSLSIQLYNFILSKFTWSHSCLFTHCSSF